MSRLNLERRGWDWIVIINDNGIWSCAATLLGSRMEHFAGWEFGLWPASSCRSDFGRSRSSTSFRRHVEREVRV